MSAGMKVMANRLERTRATLEQHDQTHVLQFWDELSADARETLLAQIEAIDFESLAGLITEHVHGTASDATPDGLEPAPYYPCDAGDAAHPFDAAAFRRQGEAMIREGKVAAFTVAGGQGTRLGWNGPKGTYPATPVTGKPLFRVFAEQILAVEAHYGVDVPWYVMTSPMNDADTRSYFSDNNDFGLSRQKLFFFPQGMMPSLERGTGRILLADRGSIALNPDGHGGSLRALAASGALADMRKRGIEHISYFQVDNPLVQVIDPLFVGLHVGAPDSSGEMSSKMVAKAHAGEKVGVFCQAGGKTMVIEYSDLPAELVDATDAAGRLRYLAGSIAVHMIGVEFVAKLTVDPHRFALPYHRAQKKVPHIHLESGQRIEPDEPNGIKLETFVFDAIPLAESSVVLETERVEEFAPIKNADGADSPATSHQLQSDRAGRWLEANGVRVPRDASGHVDARIEIAATTALESGDLAHVELPGAIDSGADVVL